MPKLSYLAQLIHDNPGAVLFLDNDWWCLRKPRPADFGDLSDEDQDDWRDGKLADSDDPQVREDGQYKGNIEGRNVLFALAEIAGLEIEEA